MSDLEKIIGIVIHGEMFTGMEAIIMCKGFRGFDRLFTLAEAKFMACCDFGKKWENLVHCPILYKIKDPELCNGHGFIGEPYVDEECLLFGRIRPEYYESQSSD